MQQADLQMASFKYKQASGAETKALKLAEAEGADTSAYLKVIEAIKGKM